MPRVNRDLERRLAARRERDRRRQPTAQPRYWFEPSADDGTGPGTTSESDLALQGAEGTAPAQPARATTAARPTAARVSLIRPSTYAEDYSYMRADLLRVVVVVGIILLALIILYFVLPH